MKKPKVQKNKSIRKNVHPLHIQELPAKYFPRNTKAKDYRNELARMMNNLRYTNEKIQYSAQLCVFTIKCITRKRGFKPSLPESFRLVEEFVYHYENFCFRLFVFREKVLKFINAVLPVGFEKDRDVKIQFMLVNPVVKQAKLVSLIREFDNKKDLGKVIEDRHSLTHKLYYGKTFDHYLRPKNIESKKVKDFKQWCKDWERKISNRAKLTEKSIYVISKMNHDITSKIIKYRDSLKKK